MKKTLALLSMTAIAFSMAACSSSANRVTDLPPGHYESKTSSTLPGGTAVDQSKSKDVYYDADGNKKETVKTTTTNDPPGLFNKSTTKSQTTDTVQ